MRGWCAQTCDAARLCDCRRWRRCHAFHHDRRRGLRVVDDARAIARAVADSPLVKTAIHGADPNWGRIVSAAGYAGVAFREEELSLSINDVSVYEDGIPASFDAESLSSGIKRDRNVSLRLKLKSGSESVRFWTCDLTAEYIRLNADYTT